MTPEQKHQWIKDWVDKWLHADQALANSSDYIERTADRNWRPNPGSHIFEAHVAAQKVFIEEAKKIEAKLLAELREIELMIEVKHD